MWACKDVLGGEVLSLKNVSSKNPLTKIFGVNGFLFFDRFSRGKLQYGHGLDELECGFYRGRAKFDAKLD